MLSPRRMIYTKQKEAFALDSPIAAGVIALLGGGAVAWLNYRINLRTLKKNPSAIASMSTARQFISVAYLILVYVVAGALGVDRMAPLLGAALGLTIPSILLAVRLAKINDSLHKKGGETAPGKGDEADG